MWQLQQYFSRVTLMRSRKETFGSSGNWASTVIGTSEYLHPEVSRWPRCHYISSHKDSRARLKSMILKKKMIRFIEGGTVLTKSIARREAT